MSELRELVKMLKNDKQTGSDYTGTVTRVDGEMAYIRLNGSDIMDTPVRMTIDSKPGDKVRVRINGGKAWITGNDTAPPTDDTRANEAYELASKMQKNLPKDIRQVTKEMEEEGELDIGNDVERIVIEHCLANNRVIPAGQTFADIQYTPWSTTMPTFVHGKFIWSRIVIYYKDGSVQYGDPYYDMGAQATAETVIAVRIAQDAADTAEDIAQAASETAGEKRRVFNTTPVPPYDVNDMWFDGAHSVVYLCTTAKGEDGTFSQSDWTEYSKDVSNHFWYDSSGAHVAETPGDVTTGASQTISSNGTVMMRNGKLITSWTGTQTGNAAINFYDMTSSVARNADLVASFGRGGITHYVNNIVCQALTPSGLSFYTPDSNNHPEAVFGSSGVNLYADGKLGMALTKGDIKFYGTDGLTELAQFGGDGMDFYDQHGGNVVNIDTNAVSYAPYLYESYKNEDLAPSVPWQIEVTSPYFSDFTTNGSLGLQVNGVMEWVSFDFSSNYAGTVESYYATVQIAYSASNKTFTFTSSAQIYLYVNIHWQSNIMASSFAFGLRSGSKGAFSATVGEGLMAEHDNQIAVGRFNKNKQDNIFEVGIGEEDDARINALEVSKDGYVTPFRGCNLVQSLYTEQLTQTYLSSASITYCVMGKMLFFSLTFRPKQNITSAVGNISIPSTIKNFESAISYPVTDGGASSTHTTSRVAWCIPYTKQFRIVGAYSTGVEYTFGGVAMLIP